MRRHSISFVSLLSVCLCIGCAKDEAPQEKGADISISAPGVDIKIDIDKEGTEETESGVDVKVKRDNGAEVTAPGIKVKVEKDKDKTDEKMSPDED